MIIHDFKIGALLVTDCAETLYCKLTDSPPGHLGSCDLMNVATGEVCSTVVIRCARPAKPRDLRKAADELEDSLIFHPERSPLKPEPEPAKHRSLGR